MYRYKGKSYATKREIAEKYGVSYEAMLMRMSRGATLKEAVEFRSKYSFKYKGKVYNSYQELIDDTGVNLTVNQLKDRINRTGSIASALKVPAHDTAVTYKGKSYSSLQALCNELGLVYTTIKNRKNRFGISVQEAVEYEFAKRDGKKPALKQAKKKAAKKTAKKAAAKKKAAKKKTATKKKAAAQKKAGKKAAGKKKAVKKASKKKKARS